MKCPSCGNTISEDIDMCPNCGYILKNSDISKLRMMPGKYIGAILVLLLIFATIGYYMVSEGDEDNYAPDDTDFYLSLEGEALRMGASEMLDSSIDDLVGEYDPEMMNVLDMVESLVVFGWEDDPENVVMVMDPIEKEKFDSYLESNLEVSSSWDIEGYQFNLVEDGMGYLWMDEVCIIGSEDGIDKSVDVAKGKRDSLEGTDSFKDIMGLMGDLDMMLYASIMDSDQVLEYEDMLGEFPEFAGVGAIASGISFDSNTFYMAMELANEEDAASAAKKVGVAMLFLKGTMEEEAVFEYDIESSGNYMVLSMIIEDLDIDDIFSNGLIDPSMLDLDLL